MEKQEIENRINAIKKIIQATIEGEKIKRILEADMKKKRISIPNYPEPIGGEIDVYGDFVYDTEEYSESELMEYNYAMMEYEDYLEEREDWKQMEEYSKQIQSKIYKEGYTLEDISNYIQTNTIKTVDIDSVDLWACKETESDLEYENSLYDDDIIEYFDGKYDFSYEGPEARDVVKVILEKGISLEELPEKLLFNTSFVNAYIEKISLIREKEQKGITPQDIEDASSSVKLGNFRSSTGQIKEIAKGEPEITTEDKNIND